ncbi:WapI family immunity protein [Anaerovorax sp. IOR16]|uniref:WapI family immunity protein n=1 Tax=Anaerovorax sp. IOR16 TaxID=2773458 RepID=UPI0019CFC23E|nr:hypothetical protein [Anaerovorax sp. IOR16]
MEIFCLNGYENEKISLELNEVIGFPAATSYEGGYDIICTLTIDVGCYHVRCDRYYSATGALYKFNSKLKECYKNLVGQAEYRLLLENDLIFNVSMTSSGHALVTGTFQERPDKHSILSFEMDTDQSCFLSVIESIDNLINTYGGMLGIE